MDVRELGPIEKVNNNIGPPIKKEEFEKILMNMEDRKATGIDGIPAKFSKIWMKEDMQNLLYELITKIYIKGDNKHLLKQVKHLSGVLFCLGVKAGLLKTKFI